MASIKVKFRPSSVNGKEGSIYYQVIHNRVVRQIRTDYRIFEREWDDKASTVIVPELTGTGRKNHLQSVVSYIEWDVKRLKTIIALYERGNKSYTSDDIILKFNRQADEQSLFSFMKGVIEQLKRLNRIRTSETYTVTLASFMKFRDGQDILLCEIDGDVMMLYEAWLKANGNHKIGIAGASTTGTLALTAAAMFPDITLTIAMTPSDFVWQGFMQGKRDGCKEWPVEGESLFSYRGKPLPYMPFCYQHPDYWHCVAAESKRTGDMVNSRKLFDDSEAVHPIEPEEYIPVENIRGKLLLIGAEDDALWDTAKYIRRMEKRLAEKPHECEVETAVYAHGTHFVFPEGMLKIMLPMGAGLFVRLAFQVAKQFPEACRQTRQDIDRRVSAAIHTWTSTE